MGRGARWLGRAAIGEVAGHFEDRYVAPVATPIVDAAVYARDAYRGGRDAVRGLHGVATLQVSGGARRVVSRGERFGAGSTTRVAGQWFHGAGDRHDAIAAIDRTAAVLGADLATIPQHLQGWVADQARPELAAWAAFRDALTSSMSALFATKWEAIDQWRDRIVELRHLVGVAGGTVAAPPVPELPQTLWERAEDGGGDSFDRWLTIARGSAYTVLAIMGVWGLFTAIRSLRRVQLVERTIADPATEREVVEQAHAAEEVEEHAHE